MYMWVGAGGFSKVMATLNHVGGSFNLFMATTLNLGFCAVCWAHFVFHHKLWPTSVSHPSSSLNSSLGLAGRNHYQLFFKILLFQVTFLIFFFIAIFSPYCLLVGLLLQHRNVPIRRALHQDILAGASMPCHFGHHRGGAYSMFCHMMV